MSDVLTDFNDLALASGPNDDSRARIQAQIQQEEEAMPAEVRAPRLYTSNCTAERLQGLLVEHGERMAVLSDESSIFVATLGNPGLTRATEAARAVRGFVVAPDFSGVTA
jgi:hypothetical protein